MDPRLLQKIDCASTVFMEYKRSDSQISIGVAGILRHNALIGRRSLVRNSSRFAQVAAIAALLSGCTFRTGLSRDAVDYNQAAEDVSNRVLLLNVLRAVEREPLHFSELAKVTGTIAATTTLSFALPFDGPLDGFSSTPSSSLRVGPTYDVLPLHGKDFMNGIMTPANPELFAYYWEQGWPREMLLFLFVREYRVADGGPPIVNYPGDRIEFLRYQGFVQCVARGQASLSRKKSSKRVSPIYTSIPPEVVVKARKEKLALQQTNGRWALYDVAEKVTLEFTCPDLARPRTTTPDEDVLWRSIERLQAASEAARIDAADRLKNSSLPPGERSTLESQLATGVLRGALPAQPGPGPSDESSADSVRSRPVQDAQFLLRSPEAMIYYLGELAREQLYGPGVPLPTVSTRWQQQNEEWPLFVVKRGKQRSADIAVSRNGTRYLIPEGPGPEAGRSMNCISLVTQLLALHKSRDSLPTTQTVIGVGGSP